MKPPATNNWRRPSELPDLRRVGIIALDTETNDEGLRADRGSAWPWHGGYICGISVAWRGENGVQANYFPLRHPDSENFERENVTRWLKDHIAAGVRIVTQKGLYDWGWLRTDLGIIMPPSEQLEEIGGLATLIDENRFSYSLDSLCAWRGLPGKDTALLEEAIKAAEFAPKHKKINVAEDIYKLPAHLVGPYAEGDPIATLGLFEDLNPVLDREGTRDAYRLEVDLLPMVHEMRWRGIRVDQSAAEQRLDYCLQKRDRELAKLSDLLGAHVSMHEIASKKWLERTFDAHGINYPRTAKGNPSFKAGKTGWMVVHPHELPRLIATASKYDAAGSTFLRGHILAHLIGDRIYGEINPHRSEEGGTKSFRFSYSNPPLQQMPSRDPELGPLIRSVFLPEEGEIWCTADCSQQEFRFVIHYAAQRNLAKAAAAAELYRLNPGTDVHQLAATWTGLDRKSAKGVNFGRLYGMGLRAFAAMIGKPEDEAREIYERYDLELPFVSQLAAMCAHEAGTQGHLVLYDGARRHFNAWAPGGRWQKGFGPCLREEAIRRVNDPAHPWYRKQLQRADTRKAMNALVQGSAARHTKIWMRACWREGIVPLLQMHDGLECSVSLPETAERVAQLGCEAVRLVVPMRVDLTFGRNWGDAKHTWAKLHGLPEPAPTSAPAVISAPSAINGAHVLPPAADNTIVEHEKPWRRIPLADLVNQPLHNGKILCPFHDDHHPSCHIYADRFYCFVCGAHGDHIDWLREVEGLNFREALDALADWEPRERSATELKDDGRTLGLAHRLWREADPIAGTLAERYLAGRHIDVDVLPETVGEALRFHPECPFNRAAHPCLIALFRDVATDAPAGIHRIALTAEAQKIERRMLGRWPTPRAVKLWPAERSLVVGEGIETVLAAATRVKLAGEPLRPAWALCSAGGVARMPVIDGVERLVILVDRDEKGETSAAECARVWFHAGRRVIRLQPRITGTDFNDVIRPSARHD